MNTLIAGSNKMVGSVVTRRMILQRVLLGCGILTALIWMGGDIMAALHYEGYNYPFQAISDLTAIGAPTRSFMTPLLNVFNVLKIGFALGIWMVAGRKRRLRIAAGLLLAWGISDLAGNFFPLHPDEPLGSFANIMHSIFAGGLTVLLMLLSIGFGADADGKWFCIYSYGTLLALLLFGAVMAFWVSASLPKQWFGLLERINAYGDMLWMVVLSVVLLRAKPASSSLADREKIIVPDAITS